MVALACSSIPGSVAVVIIMVATDAVGSSAHGSLAGPAHPDRVVLFAGAFLAGTIAFRSRLVAWPGCRMVIWRAGFELCMFGTHRLMKV
jgi:hypothetical protein